MAKQQTEKRYKLLDTVEQSSGKCLDCGYGISIEYRYYRDKETGKEVSARVRTSCDCSKEYDPYDDK